MKHALTPAQEAALDLNKHIFVEAGAGSGKTTVLVERYLKILATHPDIDLSQIIAFTFTQKAAQEMQERIQEKVQEEITDALGIRHRFDTQIRQKIAQHLAHAPIGTIHQFCSQLLRKHALDLDLDPDFSLLESSEAKQLLRNSIDQIIRTPSQNTQTALHWLYQRQSLDGIKKDILLLFDLNIDAKAAQKKCQDQANTLGDIPDPEDKHCTQSALTLSQHLLTLYTQCQDQYQSEKTHRQSLDFDDLIHLSLQLLEKYPHIKTQLQTHTRFLMTDEAQDTDPKQWALIHHIIDTPTPANTFIVGDSKQAIYGFRGADPSRFIEEKNTFKTQPSTHTCVALSDNFRSQKAILNCLNPLFKTLFENSQSQDDYHPLTPHRNDTSAQVEMALLDPNTTSPIDTIARWILNHQKNHPNTALHDYAIILRNKKHMKNIETGLANYTLPCQIRTPLSRYQHNDITFIYSLIKGLIDPSQNLAWKTCLTSPLLFDLTEDDIFTAYENSSEDRLLDKLDQMATKHPNLESICQKIKNWCQNIHCQPLATTLKDIFEEENIWKTIKNSPNGQKRIENIEKLFKKIAHLGQNPQNSAADIAEILETAIKNNHWEDEDTQNVEENHIQLLTIHGAKGLEFPVVILPALNDRFNYGKSKRIVHHKTEGIGLSMSQKSGQNIIRKRILSQIEADTQDEEKRLFYVACTRAKDHLLWVAQNKPSSNGPHSYLDFVLDCATPNVEKNTLDFNFNLSIPLHTNIEPSWPQTHTKTPKNNTTKTTSNEVKERSKKATPTSTAPRNTTPLFLSPSQIVDFLSCPKKYYYSPLKNALNQSPLNTEKKPDEIAPNDYGTLIHTLLDQIVKTPSIDTNAAINILIQDHAIPKSAQESTRNRLQTDATQFKESPTFQHIQSADTQKSEHPFTLNLHPLIVDGRIDMQIHTQGTWEIIDYKSNRLKADRPILLSQDYTNQMMLYLLALQKEYPDQKSYKATLYFTATTQCITVEKNAAELAQFEAKLRQLPQQICTHHFTPPKQETCQQCPILNVWENCPTTKT